MSSSKLQPKPGVMNIDIYVPGKSSAPAGVRLHKLSSNETPLGSSPAAQDAIAALAGKLELYPDGSAAELKHATKISLFLSNVMRAIDPEVVVIGIQPEKTYAGEGLSLVCKNALVKVKMDIYEKLQGRVTEFL